MSNGNWVNEVGNQGMMFLFCSGRKKKNRELVFLWWQTSLSEFWTGTWQEGIPLRILIKTHWAEMCLCSLGGYGSAQGHFIVLQTTRSGISLHRFSYLGEKSKKLHTQVTHTRRKSHEGVLPVTYLTFSTAGGRRPDFKKNFKIQSGFSFS